MALRVMDGSDRRFTSIDVAVSDESIIVADVACFTSGAASTSVDERRNDASPAVAVAVTMAVAAVTGDDTVETEWSSLLCCENATMSDDEQQLFLSRFCGVVVENANNDVVVFDVACASTHSTAAFLIFGEGREAEES